LADDIVFKDKTRKAISLIVRKKWVTVHEHGFWWHAKRKSCKRCKKNQNSRKFQI